MATYESDCTNVYISSGDGYSTPAAACNSTNCATVGQYLGNNGYSMGGSCGPFTDTTGSANVSQTTDGSTYGFQSDGVNWYYEAPFSPVDHQYPQNACSAPMNPYQNMQSAGSCPTENFKLFGMSNDKSVAILIVLLLVLVAVGGVCYVKFVKN